MASANWDAKLWFRNRHGELNISIDRFDSYILDAHKDPLSCATVEPIHMGPLRNKFVHIQFNVTGCGDGDQPLYADGVQKRMERE